MCNCCGGDAPDNCCPLCNLIRMAYGGESLSWPTCDMTNRRFCCSWMEGNWRGVGFLTRTCPSCGAGIVWPGFCAEIMCALKKLSKKQY